jgi:ribose 5-phosphate isomerase B
MRIALGSDHRGFRYKEIIKGILNKRGIAFDDFGAFSEESVDYPDYGQKAAKAVASKEADFGVLICGTGNGMAIVANKIKGIRAGLATNPDMARLMRSHNNANVLVLSEMFTPEAELEEMINSFIDTAFEGGRHARRVSKIDDLE